MCRLALKYTFTLSLQVKFAQDLDISANKASQLFIYFGLFSMFGRIVSGRLCDITWLDPHYIYQFSLILDGTAALLLPQATSFAHLAIYASFHGLADGIFVCTLYILLLRSVEPALRNSAFGFGSMTYSIPVAGGPALAGKVWLTLDRGLWMSSRHVAT